MKILGLQKTTLIDYPKKVACVVFLPGCNFRCPFCHSSELVLPEKIKDQAEMSEQEFFSFLGEKKGLLEGVVVCGGEPTLSKDLPEFISKIKEMGFLTKLDTNGSNPEVLRQLIENNLIDYVAMDIKTSKANYDKVVCAKTDIGKINESVELLKNSNIDFEFRTTVVPNLINREDVKHIAKWVGGKNVNYYLQNFRSGKTLDSKFASADSYSDEELKKMKDDAEPWFNSCKIRNHL